jgi:hypothetical protein
LLSRSSGSSWYLSPDHPERFPTRTLGGIAGSPGLFTLWPRPCVGSPGFSTGSPGRPAYKKKQTPAPGQPAASARSPGKLTRQPRPRARSSGTIAGSPARSPLFLPRPSQLARKKTNLFSSEVTRHAPFTNPIFFLFSFSRRALSLSRATPTVAACLVGRAPRASRLALRPATAAPLVP